MLRSLDDEVRAAAADTIQRFVSDLSKSQQLDADLFRSAGRSLRVARGSRRGLPAARPEKRPAMAALRRIEPLRLARFRLARHSREEPRRLSGEQGVSLEQVPLAPLRWENISVPVDSLDHAEDVPDRLLEETVRLVRRLGETGHSPRALGLRVRLTGSPHCYDEIREWISRGDWSALGRDVEGTAVFFNKITDAMELELDLAGIASGDDPAALLARRLLILGQDDERSRALLEEARERLSSTAGEQMWSPVQDHRNATDPLSDDALRELLLRSGKAALSAMMSGEAP